MSSYSSLAPHESFAACCDAWRLTHREVTHQAALTRVCPFTPTRQVAQHSAKKYLISLLLFSSSFHNVLCGCNKSQPIPPEFREPRGSIPCRTRAGSQFIAVSCGQKTPRLTHMMNSAILTHCHVFFWTVEGRRRTYREPSSHEENTPARGTQNLHQIDQMCHIYSV